MTVLVVSNNVFNKMQSFKTLASNQKERQQMKYTFLDRIKENVPLRWNRASKLIKVIDEIIYKATDRGYSFNGRETLAKKCVVSLRTVDKAIKILKESDEVIVAYRHNPSSNGYKTPIIFLKKHEYFMYWKELLHLEDDVSCEVDNSKKVDLSNAEAGKMDLYHLYTKKQESNIIYSNPSHTKIVQFIINRVQDSIKKGTHIKYLSSYIDRTIRSLEKQSLYAENIRLAQAQRQKETELSNLAERIGIKKQNNSPIFYNWLDE